MVYWSFNSFSLLIADLTVTAEVVLQNKQIWYKHLNVTTTQSSCIKHISMTVSQKLIFPYYLKQSHFLFSNQKWFF